MSHYKSSRSKATDIPQSVRHIVYSRDDGKCLWCGRQGLPNAHYISRAKGGLGIEENILTLCIDCHNAMDNGRDTAKSRSMKEYMREYLKGIYPDWSEEKLVYRKWT